MHCMSCIRRSHQQFPEINLHINSRRQKRGTIARLIVKHVVNSPLPIHWACEQGQSFEVIDALIKEYPDGLKERDGDGRLQIRYALMKQARDSPSLSRTVLNMDHLGIEICQVITGMTPKCQVIKKVCT